MLANLKSSGLQFAEESRAAVSASLLFEYQFYDSGCVPALLAYDLRSASKPRIEPTARHPDQAAHQPNWKLFHMRFDEVELQRP
jgi:hypothetical protein